MAPTTSQYDCRPYIGGNDETCAMLATAGTWHIMVLGYTAFSDVSLVATYGTGGGGGTATELQSSIPSADQSGDAGQSLLFSFDVPSGATNLIFHMTGTAGDADLYVRFGAPPTVGSFDCRPYLGGSNEVCAMPNATPGTWYVLIEGYTAFAGVRLLASYGIAGGNLAIPSPVPVSDSCVTTARENTVASTLPCPVGASGSCRNYSIPVDQNGSKGTATITDALTGQYTYVPQGTAWGVDTFSYVAEDSVTGIPYTATAVVIFSPRIMPPGDSITAGITSGDSPVLEFRVGYRQTLYDTLVGGGYPMDFVGSQNDGYSVAGFDSNHEGHTAWSAFEMIFGTSYIPSQDPACPTCNITDWLNTEKPDIILLHIGTNDFTTDTTDVAAILNAINQWSISPSGNPVAVFLAQIINRFPYQAVDVLTFNQNILALAQSRESAGVGPLTLIVDQESALEYPTDLLSDPDGLHPDDNGYIKMANRWYTDMVSSGLMLKCP